MLFVPYIIAILVSSVTAATEVNTTCVSATFIASTVVGTAVAKSVSASKEKQKGKGILSNTKASR